MEIVQAEDHRQEVQRRQAQLREKLRRLQRAYFDVELDEAAYRREKVIAEDQLAALVLPDRPAILQAGQFLETLAAAWTEATPREQRELLTLLLDAVIVDVLGSQLVAVKPKPIYEPLFRQVPELYRNGDGYRLAKLDRM